MHYSSHDARRPQIRDEVKVAVLADSLQAEQANQQRMQEIVWATVAIAALSLILTLG